MNTITGNKDIPYRCQDVINIIVIIIIYRMGLRAKIEWVQSPEDI